MKEYRELMRLAKKILESSGYTVIPQKSSKPPKKAKSRPIPTRIPNDLYILIKRYAIMTETNVSALIRQFIMEGLYKRAFDLGKLDLWRQNIKNRNPLISLTACDKCGNQEKTELLIYYIDGKVTNLNPANMAILCTNCLKKLNKFIQHYNRKEKFAAWFFSKDED